nr:hypothetical protein [Bacteroidota bacterium]
MLGRNIIPLLIEKIVKEKDFFSMYIFERLIESTFIIHREIDDPLILLGEQARAIETAKDGYNTIFSKWKAEGHLLRKLV